MLRPVRYFLLLLHFVKSITTFFSQISRFMKGHARKNGLAKFLAHGIRKLPDSGRQTKDVQLLMTSQIRHSTVA
jgi:hypothetical protein